MIATNCCSIVGVWLLACGLGSLAAQEQGAEGSKPQSPPASVWDGVYTADQASRGEALYAERCGECHGEALGGDDMSPPLIGSDFLWDWNGLTLGALFERIVISMPEENPKSMTAAQKADVLAYVLRQNEIPAGDTELASTKRELEPIRIDAQRPADP